MIRIRACVCIYTHNINLPASAKLFSLTQDNQVHERKDHWGWGTQNTVHVGLAVGLRARHLHPVVDQCHSHMFSEKETFN